MLVLSRKLREQILIGEGIEITVLGVQGNRVRLGFQCPSGVKVLRGEIAHRKPTTAPVDYHAGALAACSVD